MYQGESTEPTSIEDILEMQIKELKRLETITAFIRIKSAIHDELQEAHCATLEIFHMLKELRQKLEISQELNLRQKELINFLSEADKEIFHMCENIPPELTKIAQSVLYKNEETIHNENDCSTNNKNTVNIENSLCNSIVSMSTISSCKKTLFNEPDTYPSIAYLDQTEFDAVPKYMIGRQTLEMINSFISSINNTLETKYKIISLGKKNAKNRKELDLYLNYKKQEMDCKDYIFFTSEDYERQTKTKLDKTKFNFLTVLRHCKRIREHRKGKELYYIVANS